MIKENEEENKIKVSIIIPIYNMQKYVLNSIMSALKQSIQDIEVICVDDGSTDESSLIVMKISETDSRVKYVYQENQGAGASRNLGICRAHGKYVMFLDPDDMFDSERVVEMLYLACEKHNVLIAGGYHYEVYDGEENCKIPIFPKLNSVMEKEIEDSADDGVQIAFEQFQGGCYHWDYIYNKSFLLENKIKYPDYKRNQDLPFWALAFWKSKQIYYVHIPIVDYRRNDPIKNQKVRNNFSDILRGYRDVLRIAIKGKNVYLTQRIANTLNYSSRNSIISNLDVESLSILLDIYTVIQDSCIHVELSILNDICNYSRKGMRYKDDMRYIETESIKNRLIKIYENRLSIKQFFESKGIKQLIIYGMGNRGLYLYDILTNEGIQNICCMDKELERIGTHKVLKPGDDLSKYGEKVAILVSLSAGNEIYTMLSGIYPKIKIFLIEDVLNSMILEV